MTVNITLDASEFESAIAELSQLPREVLRGLLDGSEDLSKLGCIHADDESTLGSGELRVLLQPSDRLKDLVAKSRGDA